MPASAGAVGLVERGLVDEADAEPRRHLLQPPRHVEGVRARFELAGAGDQRQRQVITEGGVPTFTWRLGIMAAHYKDAHPGFVPSFQSAFFDFPQRLQYPSCDRQPSLRRRDMRLAKCLAVAAFAATAFIALSPASARIGVVMMHGNGSWGGQFAPMVPIMAAAGYGFETPDMCWADIRQYDHTAEDCMADVDKAIDRLKAKGYDQIVVGGHSMGGINTLLYAANHKGLAGVIVFAPSSRPSRTNSDSLVLYARGLVAKGLGDQRVDFPTNGINSLYVPPRAWLFSITCQAHSSRLMIRGAMPCGCRSTRGR